MASIVVNTGRDRHATSTLPPGLLDSLTTPFISVNRPPTPPRALEDLYPTSLSRGVDGFGLGDAFGNRRTSPHGGGNTDTPSSNPIPSPHTDPPPPLDAEQHLSLGGSNVYAHQIGHEGSHTAGLALDNPNSNSILPSGGGIISIFATSISTLQPKHPHTITTPLNSAVEIGTVSVTVNETSSMPNAGQTLSSSTIPSSSSLLSGHPTPSSSPMSSGSPSAIQTKAIVGGVAGATVTVLLGAIVFCIMRRKRRPRTAHSALAQTFNSLDVRGQSILHSAHLRTTTQPFLEFPTTRDRSTSKGIITDQSGSILAQKTRGDIEQAVDPFRDPVHTGGGSSNSNDENRGVRDTLTRFEGDLQRLCMLAQSGQLSTEDQVRLEEIRRTAGLIIPCGLGSNRSSVTRSSSSGSSSSPPSYHTHSC